MPKIARESAIVFADQLRSARLAALADAEAFDGIIHVIERLGSYLAKERLGDEGKYGSLGKYEADLTDLAANSWMAVETPGHFRNLLTPFTVLYKSVMVTRNDALHQGAFARHLTQHAIELGIILEDALSGYMSLVVADFMVRNPVCAELWQPIGFIRQQMLANSYSYLPVSGDDGTWHTVSDAAIATFLGPERKGELREKRLASTLREASVTLMPAKFVDELGTIADAMNRFKDGPPVLLVNRAADPKRLLGILTAFDLL